MSTPGQCLRHWMLVMRALLVQETGTRESKRSHSFNVRSVELDAMKRASVWCGDKEIAGQGNNAFIR